MSDKKSLRPVYNELQGYLSQAPQIGEHGSALTRDATLWQQLNSTIDELNAMTSISFDKFKVTGIKTGQMQSYISVSEYRTKLGGLIARLHGTYFSDEPAPFSGMPSTTITLSNQQHQLQHQSLVVEFSASLEGKISSLSEGKEKRFLTEVKDGIASVKDFTSLVLLITELAAKYGISIATLTKLFS